MDPRPIKHYSFYNFIANEKRGIWCLERGWRKGRQMLSSWHSTLVCDVQTREAPSLPLRVHLTPTCKVVLPSAPASLCVWVWVWVWACECVNMLSVSIYVSVWVCQRACEHGCVTVWAWVCDYEHVSMSMWACVCVCEYVSVNVWVWASMWVCEYANMCMLAWVYDCEHVSMSTWACVCVCEYVRVNMTVCVSMCVSGPGLQWVKYSLHMQNLRGHQKRWFRQYFK